MKKFLPIFMFISVLLLLVTSMGLFTPAQAHFNPTNTPKPTNTKTATPSPTPTAKYPILEKVKFCHATSSMTNPYTFNDVSVNTWHVGHREHEDDIWAAFSYFRQGNLYNQDAQGDQSLLANECEIPPTPTFTPTNTRIVPTEIIIPTGTVVPPTEVPPTEIPPTETQVPPTPTGTYEPPQPTPTEIPPSCEPYFTGEYLYQLHMNNANALHYGYFLLDGDKEGICQIVTGGSFPNAQFVQQYCNCKMPLDFSWRTDSYDVFQIWKTCDGRTFYKNGDEIVVPYGAFTFGLYCSSASCPVK